MAYPGGEYPFPKIRKSCAKARGGGHGRFGRLAAAYCLAFYSYNLVVSSDSDSIL